MNQTLSGKPGAVHLRPDHLPGRLLHPSGLPDPESGKTLVFITNNFSLPAATICALYKSRWQVELFFKWIKQHLRIKQFYGTSENAVKTQIWIAVSVTRSKTTPPEPAQKSTEPPRARTRSARTKQIAGHFPEEVAWQLRELAVERRATVQALLGEALNDLFQKHGKPEIATGPDHQK